MINENDLQTFSIVLYTIKNRPSLLFLALLLLSSLTFGYSTERRFRALPRGDCRLNDPGGEDSLDNTAERQSLGIGGSCEIDATFRALTRLHAWYFVLGPMEIKNPIRIDNPESNLRLEFCSIQVGEICEKTKNANKTLFVGNLGNYLKFMSGRRFSCSVVVAQERGTKGQFRSIEIP